MSDRFRTDFGHRYLKIIDKVLIYSIFTGLKAKQDPNNPGNPQ